MPAYKDHRKIPSLSFSILLIGMLLIPACSTVTHPVTTVNAPPTYLPPTALFSPTPIEPSPTERLTSTPTPGPTPTSTPLPPLVSHSWQAAPIMVEAALIKNEPINLHSYIPFFILYGDGLLVRRTCEDDECHYLQQRLSKDEICRLVNSIDRTGFLSAGQTAFYVPEGSGTKVRLSVQVYSSNQVEINDLNRWATSVDWFDSPSACSACFITPLIDPAYLQLYRLLTTYPVVEMSGLQTDRLAIWITKPVISGAAQVWPSELPSLAELAVKSTCPDDSTRQAAVIIEGPPAMKISDLLSRRDFLPIFEQNGQSWQIQSRWLLPGEKAATCQQAAGINSQTQISTIVWSCSPGNGTIPTPTATITPTPSITPTPLR